MVVHTPTPAFQTSTAVWNAALPDLSFSPVFTFSPQQQHFTQMVQSIIGFEYLLA